MRKSRNYCTIPVKSLYRLFYRILSMIVTENSHLSSRKMYKSRGQAPRHQHGLRSSDGCPAVVALVRVTSVVCGGTPTSMPSSCSAGAIFSSSSTYFRGDRYQSAKASGKCWQRTSLNCFGVPLHCCRSCIHWQIVLKSGADLNGSSFFSLC